MNRTVVIVAHLAATVLTTGGCGCESDEPDVFGVVRGTVPADPFWVMTYNVNFEQPSVDTVVAIADADADLVVLQEITPYWEQEIRGRLTDRYPHISIRHADAEGGMAILSRYPLTDVEYGVPTDGGFPSWCATVSDTPRGDLRVVHVHLHPPLDEDGHLVTGFFTTGAIRERELREHLECFEATPDLVMGDFNEGSGDAVDLLLERGMRESQSAFPPVERTWTWDEPTDLEGRPDHIFVGPSFRVAAVQVVEAGGSDHRPLRAAIVDAP